MKYLLTEAQLQHWEAELALPGAAAPELLVRLSWALRQRDSRRALALADQARPLLDPADAADARLLLRLNLVEAELLLLQARMDPAEALALRCEAEARAQGEHAAHADACLLLGVLAEIAGRAQPARLDAAVASAAKAGDEQRQRLFELRAALYDCYRDPVGGRARHAALAGPDPDPAIAAWSLELQGTMAAQASDYGVAAGTRMQAYEAALQHGQIERAVMAAHNAAAALQSLSELELALQWLERGIALARESGWPVSLALSLGQSGETLRLLGRQSAAAEMLAEARRVLQPLPRSRNYALMLRFTALLEQDRGHWAEALEHFAALEQTARLNRHPDMAINGCCGQASMLARLQRFPEAALKAQQALELAQQSRHLLRQIEALRVLADLYAQGGLTPADGRSAAELALHHLQQALALARSLPGYQAPPELLEKLAEALAERGDWAEACAMQREAAQAWRAMHSERADKRAIAMQAMQRSEGERAELQHQRRLAAEQARRVAALKLANESLESLAIVGREITVEQGATGLFSTLERHVRARLPAARLLFGPLLVREQALLLRESGRVGEPVQTRLVPLTAAQAPARCLLSGSLQESNTASGFECLLPLRQADQRLGVLGVRLEPGQLLEPAQRQWLRGVAGFAAIALAHAQAYERLSEAREQLLSQQRRVALGAMVAGVAHEVNTPLGNALMAASTLREDARALSQAIQQRQLRRSALAQHLERGKASQALMRRALLRVMALVQRYLQAGAAPSGTRREPTALLPLVARAWSSATAMQEQLPAQLHWQPDVDERLWLESRPEVLEQVLTQLLDNALRHGLAERSEGRVEVRAVKTEAGRLQLQVADDGQGIAVELRDRVFDPFFSTRFGQGGSGLGLHLCRQWVQAWLGGSLQLEPGAPRGSCFVLDLPLSVQD